MMDQGEPASGFDTEIGRLIWAERYRHGGSDEPGIAATWRRVARALAQDEASGQGEWEERFFAILAGFQFLPGGRILAGAGTRWRRTLLNCFVMGEIEDSIPGIFRALEEGAITMQQGGGVGYDFSTLRPRLMPARTAGSIASGPVSFMHVWDAMCATIRSTGARRGAMMGVLRCDHPDIASFIAAKSRSGELSHFNLSVLVTDAFMRAVDEDAPWLLKFPAIPPYQVTHEVSARALWQSLLEAAFNHGEPGILFIDRINAANNLRYCEHISAANPCGEAPMPPYGGCDLGSINLAALVVDPFTRVARLDWERLRDIVPVAVRMLDNALDATCFPLPQQALESRTKRRIGLGITGLADALIMLGLRYGEPRSIVFAMDIMREICHGAYRASAALAAEKGAFPAFRAEPYLAAPFIAALPADIRAAIARAGLRNSHLLAVAPTGSISLLAGNVSSGMEPVFAADEDRVILDALGRPRHVGMADHAVRLWRGLHREDTGVPEAFVAAESVSAGHQLAMQAALQTYVDQSISKTITLAADAGFGAFSDVFSRAHAMGLKGCAVFRPGAAAEAVIRPL